ncbi:MAG: hypothetical protein ACP59X_21060 [Solidesulfovibrio sp. DCME]|uniref:hypothetical protein n=1 Tax=Solidesulfovibrio sp. DCME TaxID=3447380 RepID=UPI003D142614
MDKRAFLFPLLCGLVAGCAAGFLVGVWLEARSLERTLAEVRTPNALVGDLATALEKSTTALVRTTAERNRLLEHLADVESSGLAGADCIPLMVWACPVKGGAQ